MAVGTTLDPGTNGDRIATTDVIAAANSSKFQRVRMALGTSTTDGGDVVMGDVGVGKFLPVAQARMPRLVSSASGTLSRPVLKYLDISASAQLAPQPGAGTRILVLSFGLTIASAVTLTFLSGGAGGTPLGKYLLGASAVGIINRDEDESGLFLGADDADLYLTLGAAVNVTGRLAYVLISGS